MHKDFLFMHTGLSNYYDDSEYATDNAVTNQKTIVFENGYRLMDCC